MLRLFSADVCTREEDEAHIFRGDGQNRERRGFRHLLEAELVEQLLVPRQTPTFCLIVFFAA